MLLTSFHKKTENFMKKFLIIILLTSCTVAANNVEVYCNGLTNDNARVEIKLGINTTDQTITVDDRDTFGMAVANKFNYVWETNIGNMRFTNILNKLDGSMIVLMPNADQNQPPVVRAQLICVAESDIKFE